MSFRKNIESAVLEFIRDRRMLLPGMKTLLAVSGGVDSAVMFRIFLSLQDELGIELGVAHFDHSLRGGESDRDREFVRKLAENHNLPVHIGIGSVKDIPGGEGIQQKARTARFNFFEQLLDEEGYDKLALAHHRDDQAESTLMAILRGYGFRGIAGIRPVSGRYIHPLLCLSRKQIEEYAEASQQPFVLDSSNLKMDYLRNRVRHSLLPAVREIFPGAEESLADFSADTAEIDDYLQYQADRILKSAVKFNSGRIILEIKDFLQYFSILQKYALLSLFRILTADFRPSPQQLDQILKLADSSTGAVMQVGPVTVSKDRGCLFFCSDIPEEMDVVLETGSEIVVSDWLLKSELIDREQVKFTAQPDVEFLDREKIKGPLRVTNWRRGDRFQPLGMHGETKVSDFLVNMKIPRLEKPRLPVLRDDEKIVWLCGLRLDDRVKVTPDTADVLKLSCRAVSKLPDTGGPS